MIPLNQPENANSEQKKNTMIRDLNVFLADITKVIQTALNVRNLITPDVVQKDLAKGELVPLLDTVINDSKEAVASKNVITNHINELVKLDFSEALPKAICIYEECVKLLNCIELKIASSVNSLENKIKEIKERKDD